MILAGRSGGADTPGVPVRGQEEAAVLKRDQKPRSAWRERRARVIVLAVVLALLAIPVASSDMQATQQLYTVSPAFDRFLAGVRDHTPVAARVLVLDAWTDPHYHMTERARYVLYPRTVIARRVRRTSLRRGVLTLSWAAVLRRARRAHAEYVVVWALPSVPPRRDRAAQDPWQWALSMPPRGKLAGGTPRLRSGWGLLVQVQVQI